MSSSPTSAVLGGLVVTLDSPAVPTLQTISDQ